MDNNELEEILSYRFSEAEELELDRFVEAMTARANVKKKQAIGAINNVLKSTVANCKANPRRANAYNQSMEVRANNARRMFYRYIQSANATLTPDEVKRILDDASNIGKNSAQKKSFTGKVLGDGAKKVLFEWSKRNKIRTDIKKTLAQRHNMEYADVKFGASESTKPLDSEYWVECENPLYSDELLLEGNGQVRKTVKATLLMVVTIIVVTILTNALRTFFGGTPGGEFTSSANKIAFLFFSRAVLTPFIEEPAKLISIRGGYGKQFFLAFNMVEFGLYTIALLGAGVSLTPIILFRSLAVMFHALTTKLQANASGTTFSKAWRLAISIVIHFIYNAVFLKYMIMGAPANALLLFAIGFFGIAFGLFSMIKKKSNNEFTTVGNTEQG